MMLSPTVLQRLISERLALKDYAGMAELINQLIPQISVSDRHGWLDDLRRVYYFQGDMTQAIATAQRQLEMRSEQPWSFWQTLSAYHRYLGDYAQARDITERLDNEAARSRDLSWHEFRWGDFDRAVDMQQHGRDDLGWCVMSVPQHVQAWSGDPGDTVILLPEAGFGDQILYARWIPLLQQRCREVYLWHQSNLDDCLSRIFGLTLIKHWDDVPADIKHMPMMSLPAKLSVQCPGNSAYLTVDPTWHRYVDVSYPRRDKRIGICSTGNADHIENHLRSVDLDLMIDAVKDLGEVMILQPGSGPRHDSVTPDIEIWEQTLALIHSCDVVVSVDTAVAHAAAALGKYVLIPVNAACYYCWPMSREVTVSDWYPDAWSVKQTDIGQWHWAMMAIRRHIMDRWHLNFLETA